MLDLVCKQTQMGKAPPLRLFLYFAALFQKKQHLITSVYDSIASDIIDFIINPNHISYPRKHFSRLFFLRSSFPSFALLRFADLRQAEVNAEHAEGGDQSAFLRREAHRR